MTVYPSWNTKSHLVPATQQFGPGMNGSFMGTRGYAPKVSSPCKRKSPGTSLVGEAPGLIVRGYILDASSTRAEHLRARPLGQLGGRGAGDAAEGDAVGNGVGAQAVGAVDATGDLASCE